MEITLISLVLGLVVGVVLGLTGAGGAILSVPLLGFFLHLDVAQAAPIGLMAVTLSAGIGAALGLRAKILRYKAAPLVLVFSIVLFWVSRNMWLQARLELAGVEEDLGPPCQLDLQIGKLIWTLPCARALAFAGVAAGFFSGLLGVGGGFIIVPSLRRFTDLPIKSIVATSLGVLTIVSFGGVLFSNVYGAMNWSLAWPFSLGSVMGLLVGRLIAKRMSGPRVQQGFAILAASVSCVMLLRLVLDGMR